MFKGEVYEEFCRIYWLVRVYSQANGFWSILYYNVKDTHVFRASLVLPTQLAEIVAKIEWLMLFYSSSNDLVFGDELPFSR